MTTSIVSQQRLTLYAIVSSIENDARILISSTLLSDANVSELFPQQLLQNAQDRMRKSAHLALSSDKDFELLHFMDFGDHFQTLQRWSARLNNGTKRIVAGTKRIETLIAIRNRVMHGRPLDFDDLPFTKNFADELTNSDPFNWTGTREILKSLRRDPSFAFEFEEDFELEINDPLFHNLPSPDFDDTGFVGRNEQLDRFKRALKGNFPIITILGDGGLGKTSLAVKGLYDSLNELSADFDAIIWTTAKTTALTATGIVEIENAIRDSAGMFRAAASAIDNIGNEDPQKAIQEWLTHFRILLVIDNLETILDEAIRHFASDVPRGSKILFTTRVGLGAYDFPIDLPGLSEKESIEYLRRVCDVYNINILEKGSREYAQDICQRLGYSPLAIKWFVQAIRAGGKPASLLADPKLVLRFCVANVVDGLSEAARQTLNALVIANRPHTLASLHFILQDDLVTISNALRELRAANLVVVSPSQRVGGDDFYLLKPLANFYVRNYFPPSQEIQKELKQRQNQLSFARDRIASARKIANVYNPNFIFIREDDAESDYIVADYLASAMNSLRRNRGDEAEGFINKAKDMSPNYFEVHRVEAFYAATEGNPLRADTAYERAVALKPDYAPLRCLYGGFLMRNDDPERAKEQFEIAVKLDENEPSNRLQLARVYTRLRQFGEAKTLLERIEERSLSFKAKKILMESWLQLHHQKINFAILQFNQDNAFEAINGLAEHLSQIDVPLLDDKHFDTLSRIPPLLHRFCNEERGSERSAVAEHAIQLLDDLLAIARGTFTRPQLPEAAPPTNDKPSALPGHRTGTIKTVVDGKQFGFIREDNGSEWFFHRSHLARTSEFESLEHGLRVRFEIGRNEKGICAVSVEILR